jgi:sugar diacid utilization regulator
VTGSADEVTAVLRDQLASFRPLLALSMMMTSSRDESEILRIAASAVPSLGGGRVEAIHLDDGWHQAGPVGCPVGAAGLEAQLTGLDGGGGPVEVDGAGWAWAYPLGNQAEPVGHLVVGRDTGLDPHHRFLVNVLAQQTGVALANARLHAQELAGAERERAAADRARTANIALEGAMTELARSSAAVQRSLDIHNRLTAVSSTGAGQEGIAVAAHELTGLRVAIEDRHGNLTAWAGPDRPDPYPKPTKARREQTLRRALEAGTLVRDRDRLIAVARQGAEVLGVIALVDPDHTAGDTERIALEYANTVLTLELVHLRALGEVELRLRRDLVEELLAGTDAQSARERALALGYDLGQPHRVVVVATTDRGDPDALFHAVRHAFRATGAGSLLSARPGGVAMLCHTSHDWERLRAAINAELGSRGRCRMGVGAPCTEPPEFPRSHGQAQLALKMQIATGSPEQATVFEDLGVYRLLSEIADLGSVESFIHHWLGALLDYDTTKNAQLVETLFTYLECGGGYDLTAQALTLHRSTLRYRLQRIRAISGHDLSDPDARFNLQLATRAWMTVHAMHDASPQKAPVLQHRKLPNP